MLNNSRIGYAQAHVLCELKLQKPSLGLGRDTESKLRLRVGRKAVCLILQLMSRHDTDMSSLNSLNGISC